MFSIGTGFTLSSKFTVSQALVYAVLIVTVFSCAVLAYVARHPKRTATSILLAAAAVGFIVGLWQGSSVIVDGRKVAGHVFHGEATVTYAAAAVKGRQNLQLKLRTVWVGGRRYGSGLVVWHVSQNRVRLEKGTAVTVNGQIVAVQAKKNGVEWAFYGAVHPIQASITQQPSFDQTIWLCDAGLDAEDAAMLHSLLFGDDSVLPTNLRRDFLGAGLLHVLAASGANLLLLEQLTQTVVFPLWRWCRLPMWLWCLLQTALSWLYAALCNFEVSIVRAAIMATHRSTAVAAGRKTSGSAGLMWAAVLTSAVSPMNVFSIGAWLSFIATAAVSHALHGGPAKSSRKHCSSRQPKASVLSNTGALLWEMLRSTLYVELWVFPVLVIYFHQVTPYSVISNVMVDPLLTVFLPLCAIVLVVSLVLHPLGILHGGIWFCGNVLHVGLQALTGVVHTIAGLPCSTLDIPESPAVWFLYVGVMGWLHRPLLSHLSAEIALWCKERGRMRIGGFGA